MEKKSPSTSSRRHLPVANLKHNGSNAAEVVRDVNSILSKNANGEVVSPDILRQRWTSLLERCNEIVANLSRVFRLPESISSEIITKPFNGEVLTEIVNFITSSIEDRQEQCSRSLQQYQRSLFEKCKW